MKYSSVRLQYVIHKTLCYRYSQIFFPTRHDTRTAIAKYGNVQKSKIKDRYHVKFSAADLRALGL